MPGFTESSATTFSSIELIIGELLGNVYRYAPGSASISIIADGNGALVIQVVDSGPGFIYPLPSKTVEVDPNVELATTGGGLQLVASLAKSLTVRDREDGGSEVLVLYITEHQLRPGLSEMQCRGRRQGRRLEPFAYDDSPNCAPATGT